MGAEGLTYQVVPVEFTQGLDTRTNRKLVAPGKWTQLTNCSVSDTGSLEKRQGHRAILPSINGHGLATHDEQLLTVNGIACQSIGYAAGGYYANDVRGALGNVSVSTQAIASTDIQDQIDVAVGLGLVVTVWRGITYAYFAEPPTIPTWPTQDASGVYCTVTDEATGAVVIPTTQLSNVTTSVSPRVVFTGATFYLTWLDATALWCSVYLPGTSRSALGTITNIHTLHAEAANPCLEACPSGSDAATLWWSEDATASAVLVARLTRTGYVPTLSTPWAPWATATVANIYVQGLTCCAIDATWSFVGVKVATHGANFGTYGAVVAVNTPGAALWIQRIDASSTVTTARNSNLTSAVIGATLYVLSDAQAEYSEGADALQQLRQVAITLYNTATPTVSAHSFGVSATFASAASVGTRGVTVSGAQGPFVCGKMFSTGLRRMVPLRVVSNWTQTPQPDGMQGETNAVNFWMLADITDALEPPSYVVVATALRGEVHVGSISGSTPISGACCSSVLAPDGSYLTAIARRNAPNLMVNGAPTAAYILDLTSSTVTLIRMRPNTSTPPRAAQLGRSTFVADGSLSAFDGASVTEAAPLMWPQGLGAVVAAGAPPAGAPFGTGSYAYCAVYEYVDAAGSVHQSAPSLPVSVTTALASNDTVTVNVPRDLVGQRASPLSSLGSAAPLCTTRTVLYGTDLNGTTFYRQPQDPTSSTDLVDTYVFPNPPILGGPLLYSQPYQSGTALANDPTPPCTALGVHQERLFIDVSDSPGEIRYSQENVDGVGLQWSDAFSLRLPRAAGSITAFASLDDKLVIFTERRIYVVTGRGPGTDGSQNGYSEPQPLPTDVGCAQGLSVVVMPFGVLFLSAHLGWHVLGRDLALTYVGEGVKAYDAMVVSSAQLIDPLKEVRITSDLGMFSLSYLRPPGQWSRHDIQTSLSGSYTPSAGVVWGGGVATPRLVTISRNGYGLCGDAVGGDNIDGPSDVVMQARTGFLHLGALEGFQRVKELYLTLSGPTPWLTPGVTVFLAVDYDDMYAADGFPPGRGYSTSLDITTTGNIGNVDIQHKLHAQKCKSVAFTISESGGLASMEAMALRIGLKRGTNKLPAIQAVP